MNCYSVTGISLGRYYGREGATLELHKKHTLSQTIREKDAAQRQFSAPERWLDVVSALVEHYVKVQGVDYVSVIPSRKGRDPRLERFLAQVQDECDLPEAVFKPDLLRFSDAALPAKTLDRQERRDNAMNTLFVNAEVRGRRVLVIDDVITSGSTFIAAQNKLYRGGAQDVTFLSLTQTISGYHFKAKPGEQMTCPECQRQMVVRLNNKDGSYFWSCQGYPKHCVRTLPYQAAA